MTEDLSHEEKEVHQLLEYRKFANEAAVSTGAAALKGLMIINGGAAVAMLGFLASLAGLEDAVRFKALFSVEPIVSFSFGAATAVTAMGFGYVVNTMHAGLSDRYVDYVRNKFEPKKLPKKFARFVDGVHILTVFLAALSLGLFLNGVRLISLLADKGFG